MDIEQTLDNDSLNLEKLDLIFKNAGIQTFKEERRLIINHEDTVSSLYFIKDIISIFTSYKIKDDADLSNIHQKLLDLNGTNTFTSARVSDNGTHVIVLMTYLTTAGVFIPHFILTVNGYFAFQKLNFKRVDCSDFLE